MQKTNKLLTGLTKAGMNSATFVRLSKFTRKPGSFYEPIKDTISIYSHPPFIAASFLAGSGTWNGWGRKQWTD